MAACLALLYLPSIIHTQLQHHAVIDPIAEKHMRTRISSGCAHERGGINGRLPAFVSQVLVPRWCHLTGREHGTHTIEPCAMPHFFYVCLGCTTGDRVSVYTAQPSCIPSDTSASCSPRSSNHDAQSSGKSSRPECGCGGTGGWSLSLACSFHALHKVPRGRSAAVAAAVSRAFAYVGSIPGASGGAARSSVGEEESGVRRSSRHGGRGADGGSRSSRHDSMGTNRDQGMEGRRNFLESRLAPRLVLLAQVGSLQLARRHAVGGCALSADACGCLR